MQVDIGKEETLKNDCVWVCDCDTEREKEEDGAELQLWCFRYSVCVTPSSMVTCHANKRKKRMGPDALN